MNEVIVGENILCINKTYKTYLLHVFSVFLMITDINLEVTRHEPAVL